MSSCCELTRPRYPHGKYKQFPTVNLPDRQWPSKVLDKPPRWLATDLRDGNQSLPDPMNVDEKKEYFHKLVDIGYKEIEVAFPSASQVDFDFTRYAVENAPDDVAIQVLSPCREQLIRRTVESLHGAKRAIVHVYLATSPLFRDVVFGLNEQESLDLAVRSTKLVRALTKDNPNEQATEWQYEFSCETFSDTPLDYSLRVMEAVKKAWEPTEEVPIIFNLPATVEMSTPNVFADQVEYISRNISDRNTVCISLHCHNDRGCAVAASELGQLAGAQRVEGCLFGNGERTGNVDLVTLGLNLYTQGVDPLIDFRNIEELVDLTERLNKIPVHPRAPYGGSLVVCAFSGSHQDAIKKGFSRNETMLQRLGDKAKDGMQWQIPYLPLDPSDVGRTYEAVIRVNSQSGKGGAAWIILRHLELDLPRGLQVNFSKHVQAEAEFKDRELHSDELVKLFEEQYFISEYAKYKYDVADYKIRHLDATQREFVGALVVNDQPVEIRGIGNGPISSFLNALENKLGYTLDVESYVEHSLGKGSKTKAVSYLEISCSAKGKTTKEWGVGIDQDVSKASLKAAISVVNRLDLL